MDEGGGGGAGGCSSEGTLSCVCQKILLKVARAKCSVKSRQPGIKRTRNICFYLEIFLGDPS